MKIGILGTGMIVKALMKSIDGLGFHAVYILGTEATREETNQLVKTYHLDASFFDYDELLDSDVDTIYVALPNHLHYEFAKKAILRKKHVIIEKPITSNLKEFIELKDLANQNACMMIEAMNVHSLPAYQMLKTRLSEIGDIKIVSLNYSQYSSRYDEFKKGNILPAFDCNKAGGALMDINVYNVHFLVGLFGKPSFIQYHANKQHGIDTSGILILTYDTFQAVCIGAKDCSASTISTIQGDLGSIIIKRPVSQMMNYEVCFIKQEPKEIAVPEKHHRLYYEFKEFIDIIDNKRYDQVNNLLHISSIVCEILQEARYQQEVRFIND